MFRSLCLSDPVARAGRVAQAGPSLRAPGHAPIRCAQVLNLTRGQVWSAERVAGLRLEVLAGRVWLTEEGSPDDVFLGPGAAHIVGGAGRVVCEADAHGPTVLGIGDEG